MAYIGRNVSFTLDDCIVTGRDFDEHLKNLVEVLERFRLAGLNLKPSKCQFFSKEVTYLGHCINPDGLLPAPSNTAKVQNWPTPRTATQVRAFWGLASFYRRFITGFSQVAAPLNRLTQKNTPFVWFDACEKSFHQLKLALVSPLLLAYPDFGKEFRLATDASNDAVGAILSQDHDNRERVIAYYSSTLTQTQRRWSTFDRELWAIVSAVRHFRHYLRGQHFTVVTDHQPLLSYKKLSIQDDTTGRRARWMVELHSYSFSIIHHRGTSHTNPDALSCQPSPSEGDARLPSSTFFHLCSLIATGPTSSTSTQTESTRRKPESSNSARSVNVPSLPTSTSDVASEGLLPKIFHHQQQDEDIQAIKHMVENNVKFSPKEIRRHSPRMRRFLWQLNRFTTRDGILYRTKTDRRKSTTLYQAVIPRSLVHEVLRLLHSHPTSGHFSAQRAFSRAENDMYWPFMHRDVMDHCETCTACEAFRNPTPGHQHPCKASPHLTHSRWCLLTLQCSLLLLVAFATSLWL